MKLLRVLVSAVLANTATSAATLAVLRELETAIAAQITTPDINLIITAIIIESRTPDIELILTFHESLRVQSKRFYRLIDSSGLRGSAVRWNPQCYLLDGALRWIIEEEKKAA